MLLSKIDFKSEKKSKTKTVKCKEAHLENVIYFFYTLITF